MQSLLNSTQPQSYLFRNARLLDPRFEEAREGYEILVENGEFKEVCARPISARSAHVIDCGGRTLMPGLMDCHVHVYPSEVNISMLEHVPVSLLAARAAPLMLGMLNRGFTTGDSAGRRCGEDHGLRGCRFAVRPARFKAILRGRDRGSRGRSRGLQPLRAGACLQGRHLAAIMKAGRFHKNLL